MKALCGYCGKYHKTEDFCVEHRRENRKDEKMKEDFLADWRKRMRKKEWWRRHEWKLWIGG